MTEVSAPQKITILKHLANGRDPGFAATVTRLPQAQVDAIAEEYGWPDLEKVRWAIDELSKTEIPTRVDHSITPGSAPRSTSAPTVRPDLSVARQPAPAPTPAPAPAPVAPRTASVNELLHQASESDHARTRNLGTKISALLADLTARLHDETAEREAKTAAAAQKAKNAKRIAELEAELARLKGKPAPAAKVSGGRTYTLVKGEFPCAHCDRVLDTAQGKAAHQRRAHEGFDPNASRQTA